MRTFNVDEIDTWGQFRLHFTSSLYVKAQKYTKDLTVFFSLLGSVCAKAACKMFVKLTPGVNFSKH